MRSHNDPQRLEFIGIMLRIDTLALSKHYPHVQCEFSYGINNVESRTPRCHSLSRSPHKTHDRRLLLLRIRDFCGRFPVSRRLPVCRSFERVGLGSSSREKGSRALTQQIPSTPSFNYPNRPFAHHRQKATKNAMDIGRLP